VENRRILEIYLKDIKVLPMISEEKEIELSKIIIHSEDEQAVEKAMKEMVEGNVRLAVKYAFQYHRRYPTSLSEMDLIEEANLGLVKAAKKYDAKMGFRFSTYAVASICSHIDRAIQNDRTIRIPLNHFKYLTHLRKLREKYGEDVSDELVMKELDISEYILKTLKSDIRNKVIELDGNEAMSLVLSSDAKHPGYEIELSELREDLMDVIEELTPFEKEIVMIKHFSGDDITYEEIASKHGVTRQRIAQVYNGALKKLKIKMKNKKRREG